MANRLRFAPLLILASLCATVAFAQQDTPAPQAADDAEVQAPPDQEVEVNEDNYRQFMELKDDLRQRTVVPEESYGSRSGLQKLDKLPEESQKHLRDELREIISRGDRWQPGDENADYPYVPSDAAQGNANLQKQEAEAWGELLDNYHAREAQIYANSARTRAAVAASGAMPGQAGEPSGDGETRPGQAAQAGQEQDSKPGSSGDSFSPNTQGADGEQDAEGVAQNAMEFLEKAGYQGGSSSSDSAQQQTGDGGQAQTAGQQGDAADSTAQSESAQAGSSESVEQGDEGVEQNAMEFLQQMGQQGDAADSAAQPESAQAGTSQEAGQGNEGTEQNAMEFLQQTGQQQGAAGAQQAADGGEAGSAGDQETTSNEEDTAATYSQQVTTEAGTDERDEPAAEGVSQNALEYLEGEGATGEQSQDTLSIEDLVKARGVVIGVDTGAAQDDPDEPPQDPPD